MKDSGSTLLCWADAGVLAIWVCGKADVTATTINSKNPAARDRQLFMMTLLPGGHDQRFIGPKQDLKNRVIPDDFYACVLFRDADHYPIFLWLCCQVDQ